MTDDTEENILNAERGGLTDLGRALRSLDHQSSLDATATPGVAVTATRLDIGIWKRWTDSATKTYTIPDDTFSTDDILTGIVIGAGALTVAAGSGVTLNGPLVFSQYESYFIIFNSKNNADVVGGHSA